MGRGQQCTVFPLAVKYGILPPVDVKRAWVRRRAPPIDKAPTLCYNAARVTLYKISQGTHSNSTHISLIFTKMRLAKTFLQEVLLQKVFVEARG